MSTTFPTAIDSFTNPTSTDTLNSGGVPHASQHANANDAIEAIETFLFAHDPRGVSGGQTLNGDTASGGDLTLKGTAHATPGSVFIQSSSIFEMNGSSGRLSLPATGSGGGILVGTDVHLYRAAADIWSTPDSLRVGGYLRVGAEAAPANTSPGDVTIGRLAVGADEAFDATTGRNVKVRGTLTDTANGAVSFVDVRPTIAPASNSSSDFRLLNFLGVIAPPTGITVDSAAGGWFDLRHYSDAAIGSLTAVNAAPLTLDSNSPGSAGAVANVVAVAAKSFARPTGTSVVSVTNVYDFYSMGYSSAGLTATSTYGLFIADKAQGTITNQIGVFVQTLAQGSINYGAHFADNRVGIGGDVAGADGADGRSAITRLMSGLELSADEMNTTNKYTPALKFMSTDSSFTTENPKLLGLITGEATETYNADTKGGMYLVLGATDNTPGANSLPTVNLRLGGTTFGIFGTTPASKQTVTGSKGGNAALTSLLTALAAYGLITDSSS